MDYTPSPGSCGGSPCFSDSTTSSPAGQLSPATPISFPYMQEESSFQFDFGGAEELFQHNQERFQHNDYDSDVAVARQSSRDVPMDDAALMYYTRLAGLIQEEHRFPDPQLCKSNTDDHVEHIVKKLRGAMPHINGTSYTEVVNPRKKSRTGDVRRPMNAYMCFSQVERKALIKGSETIQRSLELEEDRQREKQGLAPQKERKPPHSTLHNAYLSKHLGKVWRTLPVCIQNYFKEVAAELKKLHKLQYPNYKYKPRKNKKRTAEATPGAACVTKTNPRPKQRRTNKKPSAAAVAVPPAAAAAAAAPFASNFLVDRPGEVVDLQDTVSVGQPSTTKNATVDLAAIKEEPTIHQAQAEPVSLGGEAEHALDPTTYQASSEMGLGLGHFPELGFPDMAWSSSSDLLQTDLFQMGHLSSRNDSTAQYPELLQGTDLVQALDSGPDFIEHNFR